MVVGYLDISVFGCEKMTEFQELVFYSKSLNYNIKLVQLKDCM